MKILNNNLEIVLSNIPKLPGVYKYYNSDKQIIYVGKAKNLYNRVNSYFKSKNKNDIKTKFLVKNIAYIDYLVTNNETEALILESNLIKEYSPKYNIQLKDNKSYPYIKITDEPIPRVIKTRDKDKSKGNFYGPFVNVDIVMNILNVFNQVFKIRKCRKKFKPPFNYQVCIYYHIGKCSGPCASKITIEEYNQRIEQIKEILNGNIDIIIQDLTKEMNYFSENLLYEKAIVVRDSIKSLQELNNKQYLSNITNDSNDYIGFYIHKNTICATVLLERNGKIIDKNSYLFKFVINKKNFLEDFLSLYYLNTEFIPQNVYIESIVKDFDVKLIIDVLKTKKNLKLNFIFSNELKVENRKENSLIKMSKENSEIYYKYNVSKLSKIKILENMKNLLNLDKIPFYIECIDIATLNGKYNTASVVTFINGEKVSSKYRQYNIKGEGHPDDYEMMKEVVARRYQKMLLKENRLPDLLVIDGGKGQVNSVEEILKNQNINIQVIGLSKKYEEIWKSDLRQSIKLPEDSDILKLLQNIRDEAHRFSNTRLKKRYKNDTFITNLTKIEGVGEKIAIKLIKKFGSLENIKKQSIDDLVNIGKISESLAKKIHQYIHSYN